MAPLSHILKRPSYVTVVAVLALVIVIGVLAISVIVNAQADASVTPLTPGYGGPNYDQPLWTITYDKAIIPVSFTSYNCTSAALVLEYATWADYTKLDWQTGATGKYTGFIPASASDLSQKVYITIPNLIPSTSYIFRVGAKCTSSSPMGSLAYTTSANQFSTPAVPQPVQKIFSGLATFQSGDAGGSIENNSLIAQKVIRLLNTGSDPDTFRTMLPVNPESRCGLRGPNDSYPANTLPNPLPTTLDISLGFNETYISVVCVTKGLPAGPFTWSYKTISVGSLTAGSEKVIAEVQDTVQVTAPASCTDSDGGINPHSKGIATGTYAGARPGYVAIYGQEPNPNTPKTTIDPFSTFIDHCSWDAIQLNEGFCDANGRLSAYGYNCGSAGCKDGVCVAPPSSSSSASSVVSECSDPEIPVSSLAKFGEQCRAKGLSWQSYPPIKNGDCRTPVCGASCGTIGIAAASFVEPRVVCGNGGVPALDFDCTTEANWRLYADRKCQSYGGVATFDTSRWTFPCAEFCNPPGAAAPPTATGAGVIPSSITVSSSPSASPNIPASSVTTPAAPSAVPSSTTTPAVTGIPPVAPPVTHLAPSPKPAAQTESTVVEKKVSKTRVQAIKKQQQALRKELRTLERSLLRKKNVAALSQIADLRDELSDLDLRDPSAAESLQSLQEEIADLRLAVTKKTKRGE